MKVDRTELIYKLIEAINATSEKGDPAKELIAMGEAMAKMGKALIGVPLPKAKAAILTIKLMNDSGLMDLKEEEVITL